MLRSVGPSCLAPTLAFLKVSKPVQNFIFRWLLVLPLVAPWWAGNAQTAHFTGVQSVVASSSLSNPQGVAADGTGNVYIADVNNYRVVKMPSTGSAYGQPVTLADRTTNGSNFEPLGVAVDGSGNVYVANLGEGNGSVFKIPWTGSAYGPQITLIDYLQASSEGLYFPKNVAVDGSGNVYIAWGFQVTKIPWTGSAYGPQLTVASSGVDSPFGLAVDGSGNVFIANHTNVGGSVLKVPWTGNAYGTPITLANTITNGGQFNPLGLAVDENGNVFIADQGDQKVIELPWTGSGYGASVTLADTATNPGFGPFGLAVDGSGNLYVADNNTTSGSPNNRVLKENLSVGDFGTFNVGTLSSMITALFRFDTGGIIGAPSVVTQGAANLDFIDAGTGTCTTNGTSHTYSAGDVCTMDVTFTPKHPGARYGAAVLTNNSGSVIATGYLQGIGVGPQASFPPGIQSVLSLPNMVSPWAVAADAAGNLYIAEAIVGYDPNNAVVKETWNGSGYTQSTIVSGLGFPTGVAVDGAGNVYIADQDGFKVYKETLSPSGTYTKSVVDGTLGTVGGLAVDGAGNVYVGRGGIGVEKETLSGGTYSRSEIFYTFYANSIGVDLAGNLYIIDGSNVGIRKETPSMGGYTESAIASGQNIGRLAVDGLGNIYFIDGQQILKEAPSGNGYVQRAVASGLANLAGLAVDPTGNLYFSVYSPDTRTGTVSKIDLADPPSLNFATTPYGATSTDSPQMVTIENVGNTTLSFPVPTSGNNPSIATSFTLNSSGTSACPMVDAGSSEAGTLAAGASCQLSVSFVPAAVGAISGSLVLTDNALNVTTPSYATQSISLGGTGTRAVPAITWPTPSAITYGTALSSTQLNASTLVAGTFSYSPAAGIALGTGPHTLTVTFTPTDTADYTTATASVTLMVNPATPAITWATPIAIMYGTALSATQLNASSTVAGTFGYTPSAGTVLGAGSHTLTATFTPTDSTDYGPAMATVSLTVKQATPSLTWATPPAISFGTALSAKQLNASASVPGTFVYNPAAGTIPPLGSDTLSVTFTPTDTADYTTATGTVTIAVNQPVPGIGSLSPAFTSAGGAAFTLTVNGSGFTAASTINWGSTALTTQYVSGVQLTAQVPASAIASAGTNAVTVQNPAPGGGSSNAFQFEVTSAGSGSAGQPSFTTVTATVAPGSTATYPVTLPSSWSSVSATCLNLPSGATCSYSGTTGAVTITTSSTTPSGTYQIIVVFTETVPASAAALALAPVLFLPLAWIRRRWTARQMCLIGCVELVLSVAAIATGCGGGNSSTAPPATHQITSSGTVSLTVQ